MAVKKYAISNNTTYSWIVNILAYMYLTGENGLPKSIEDETEKLQDVMINEIMNMMKDIPEDNKRQKVIDIISYGSNKITICWYCNGLITISGRVPNIYQNWSEFRFIGTPFGTRKDPELLKQERINRIAKEKFEKRVINAVDTLESIHDNHVNKYASSYISSTRQYMPALYISEKLLGKKASVGNSINALYTKLEKLKKNASTLDDCYMRIGDFFKDINKIFPSHEEVKEYFDLLIDHGNHVIEMIFDHMADGNNSGTVSYTLHKLWEELKAPNKGRTIRDAIDCMIPIDQWLPIIGQKHEYIGSNNVHMDFLEKHDLKISEKIKDVMSLYPEIFDVYHEQKRYWADRYYVKVPLIVLEESTNSSIDIFNRIIKKYYDFDCAKTRKEDGPTYWSYNYDLTYKLRIPTKASMKYIEDFCYGKNEVGCEDFFDDNSNIATEKTICGYTDENTEENVIMEGWYGPVIDGIVVDNKNYTYDEFFILTARYLEIVLKELLIDYIRTGKINFKKYDKTIDGYVNYITTDTKRINRQSEIGILVPNTQYYNAIKEYNIKKIDKMLSELDTLRDGVMKSDLTDFIQWCADRSIVTKEMAKNRLKELEQQEEEEQ